MPDIVLNTAADKALASAWLTDVLGTRPDEVDFHLSSPRLTAEWPGVRAELHVEARGAGGSTATLEVAGEASDELAGAALDALSEQVDQNFNPG